MACATAMPTAYTMEGAHGKAPGKLHDKAHGTILDNIHGKPRDNVHGNPQGHIRGKQPSSMTTSAAVSIPEPILRGSGIRPG